jgi:hypothetical protein
VFDHILVNFGRKIKERHFARAKKFATFLNQDQKFCANSCVVLMGYVGGKVPYETHRMDLTPKLLS